MVRPLRIEFSNAFYHVTSRGDRCEAIYENDNDRELFLEILGQVIESSNWLCHAYCLMTNHYHLVIETPEGNLSQGMRQLNGVYTQQTNWRHGRSGHLFQGRYKAILVDADAYQLELARYVVLNPVRAGIASDAEAWLWSSHRAMIGASPAPKWLTTDGLLARFSTNRDEAVQRYLHFVAEGIGQVPIWNNLNRQIFLGDDRFVARMQSIKQNHLPDVNIPKVQQRPPAPPLASIAASHQSRDEAITVAYATGEYSYQQIAEFFGIHFTTVGRIVRAARKGRTENML